MEGRDKYGKEHRYSNGLGERWGSREEEDGNASWKRALQTTGCLKHAGETFVSPRGDVKYAEVIKSYQKISFKG